MAANYHRILVVAAHPDDEVLGCGGSLLKWKDAGHQITVAWAGFGRPQGPQFSEGMAVVAEAGWRVFESPGFPDQEFDMHGVLTIARWIESAVQIVNPTRVLIHSGGELNQDHEILHRASLIALRGRHEIFAFEVPGSTNHLFAPNLFVDVSAHWKRKSGLIQGYASELRNSPHPRSLPMLEAKAQVWGSLAGVELAEAFQIVRMVWGQTSGTAS